jgi:mRNA interferase RelE/StbE
LVSQNETLPGRAWRIEISRTAEKQITKLARTAQKSIQRFLRERLISAENPRQWGKPLHGEKRDLWRYHVGDYRLICDIQNDKVLVLVLAVGHRKDVYR